MDKIERRVFAGEWNATDVEWLAGLSVLFARVDLSALTDCGMDYEEARRFAALLSLAPRATGG